MGSRKYEQGKKTRLGKGLLDDPLSDLKSAHTRTLLSELRRMRVLEQQSSPWKDITPDDGTNPLDYITRLKAELATREHIPTKKEAKELRREKAKGRRP